MGWVDAPRHLPRRCIAIDASDPKDGPYYEFLDHPQGELDLGGRPTGRQSIVYISWPTFRSMADEAGYVILRREDAARMLAEYESAKTRIGELTAQVNDLDRELARRQQTEIDVPALAGAIASAMVAEHAPPEPTTPRRGRKPRQP